jgi:hypothetical protein
VGKYIPSKHKALSSNPILSKKSQPINWGNSLQKIQLIKKLYPLVVKVGWGEIGERVWEGE